MIDGLDDGLPGGLPGGLHDGIAPDPDHDLHHDLHGDHHLYLPTDGGMVDLGTDLIDTDHDGIGDTVALHEPDGLTVVSDSHENGVADRVTTFGSDGTYETWSRAEGSTHWVLVEHGRVGGP